VQHASLARLEPSSREPSLSQDGARPGSTSPTLLIPAITRSLDLSINYISLGRDSPTAWNICWPIRGIYRAETVTLAAISAALYISFQLEQTRNNFSKYSCRLFRDLSSSTSPIYPPNPSKISSIRSNRRHFSLHGSSLPG
jgi:hypothetical protein